MSNKCLTVIEMGSNQSAAKKSSLDFSRHSYVVLAMKVSPLMYRHFEIMSVGLRGSCYVML